MLQPSDHVNPVMFGKLISLRLRLPRYVCPTVDIAYCSSSRRPSGTSDLRVFAVAGIHVSRRLRARAMYMQRQPGTPNGHRWDGGRESRGVEQWTAWAFLFPANRLPFSVSDDPRLLRVEPSRSPSAKPVQTGEEQGHPRAGRCGPA